MGKFRIVVDWLSKESEQSKLSNLLSFTFSLEIFHQCIGTHPACGCVYERYMRCSGWSSNFAGVKKWKEFQSELHLRLDRLIVE